MATVRSRRARSGSRPGSRLLVLGVSAFVGVNLFLLLRGTGHGPGLDSGVGEGLHRYRQTEEQADVSGRAAVADQAATLAAGAGEAAVTAAGGQHQAQQQEQQQQQDAGGSDGGSNTEACHIEEGAEYDGEVVVQWGDKHYKESAAECCTACQAATSGPHKCNVWVYCASQSGCGGKRKHKECWLKHSKSLNPAKPAGRRNPGDGWTSGALFSAEEAAEAAKKEREKVDKEQAYLDSLKNNESLPLVYFDVEIKGKPVGRIEMVLFPDISPRAAENFRQLCTGESGVVPDEPGREGAGKARHFKGRPFYRIIDQFIDQAGVETESVFGGQFKDDPGGLKLKHDRKGLLSMANMGHDTNTAHFSIMMGPAPHLNGDYTIFGQVVSGFDAVDAINALSKGKKDNTATAEDGALIADSGQIRKGSIVPDLKLGLR